MMGRLLGSANYLPCKGGGIRCKCLFQSPTFLYPVSYVLSVNRVRRKAIKKNSLERCIFAQVHLSDAIVELKK